MCPGRPGSGGCSSVPQGKVRLWVNTSTDKFNCWHCGYQGGSLAPLMVWNSPEQREYLHERPTRPVHHETKKDTCRTLPPGYTPFGLGGSHREAPYLHYLRGRNLTERTVALYRMGYVADGRLAGRVVVPSFDRFGLVNFWSARSIHSSEERYRYILPDASKDIVSNEHMVDWTQPVYLVEGIFDEIAVGPQAIALYGKFMQPQLALRLVQTRPPIVNICLDSDAMDEACELINTLMDYDLPCALVELGSKDPALSGRSQVVEAARSALEIRNPISRLRARLTRLSSSLRGVCEETEQT